MKYITVKLLQKMNACKSGIDEFCYELQKRNLKRVSVDKCIQIAIEIGSEYVSWLLVELGKYLTDKFDWIELSGYEWMRLLTHQPQFEKYCDWDKLSGLDWRWLLIVQPQFHEHCDWTKLNDEDWSYLLIHQPQFEKYKPVD